jgi:hypothetical protein
MISLLVIPLIVIAIVVFLWWKFPNWFEGKKTAVSMVLLTLSSLPDILSPELVVTLTGAGPQGTAGLQIAFLLLTAYGAWDKQQRLNRLEKIVVADLDREGA